MSNAWYQLSELIGHDLKCEATAVPFAFGDRYLFANNKWFTKVRLASLEAGFSFSMNEDWLWHKYQRWSLSCLDNLMANKRLPYYNTAEPLSDLALQQPEVKVTMPFLLVSLVPNFYFHESTHGVAYHLLQVGLDEAQCQWTDPEEKYVWLALLTECFANTVEVFAWMEVKDEIGAFMMKLHSASTFTDPRLRELFIACREIVPEEMIFQACFLSYFCARLSADPMGDGRHMKIINALYEINNRPKQRLEAALIAQVARFGEYLKPDFREIVAPSYFSIKGCLRQYEDLRRTDYLNGVHYYRLLQAVTLLSKFVS